VAISDDKPGLGPWKLFSYGEFDGDRHKRVLVKIMG
jgi:thiamine phosphate synthase YjbQ (UPF0047 family)